MMLPNVNGHNVPQAALAFVDAGIPIVPFDPTRGNHKACGNLVGGGDDKWYKHCTTDKDQLREWRKRFGKFAALATSPGECGCVVIDLDRPKVWPKSWRHYLTNPVVPYVNTRPNEHKFKGHYWFQADPHSLPAISNRAFEWGELRAVGGGLVLPPYINPQTGDVRTVVRDGAPPPLPPELEAAFVAGKLCESGRSSVDLATFLAQYRQETRAYKLKGLQTLFAREWMNGGSRHNAAKTALTVGFSESRLGYVSAQHVYDLIRSQWDKSGREFHSLAEWTAAVAESTPLDVLKAKSDRTKGFDSRRAFTPPPKHTGTI